MDKNSNIKKELSLCLINHILKSDFTTNFKEDFHFIKSNNKTLQSLLLFAKCIVSDVQNIGKNYFENDVSQNIKAYNELYDKYSQWYNFVNCEIAVHIKELLCALETEKDNDNRKQSAQGKIYNDILKLDNFVNLFEEIEDDNGDI